MQLFEILPSLVKMGIPQVINIIDQLPNHKTNKYPQRNMEQVDKFIFHHMASEAPLMNQALYHVNGRGWARIGYSIVIDRDRIYQTNYLDVTSNHCSGQNPNSIGVAVLADLSKRSLTEIERSLINAVFVSLNAMFPGRTIHPHSQFVKTACPCTDVNRIITDVKTQELNLSLNDTPNDQNAKAYSLRVRVEDLYVKATTENPFKNEAVKKLSRITDMMQAEGLI